MKRGYKPQYDPDIYKRMVGNMLNLENDETEINGLLDTSPSQFSATSKEQLRKRQPTPYHSTASRSRLTTGNFNGEGQVLFDSNCSNYADRSNKLSKGVAKNKLVGFSELPKSEKKPIKRQSTPYHQSANKKLKARTCVIEKNVLFPSQNRNIKNEGDCEDIQDVSAQSLFSVSISESPKRKKLKKLSNKQEHTKIIRNIHSKKPPKKPKDPKVAVKNVNISSKKISNNETNMETSELVCDNEKYDSIMSNTGCFLTEDENDSEYSDNLELDFTPPCDGSIASNDLSLIGNNDVETNSIEKENEDISETFKVETSADENSENESAADTNLNLCEEIVGKAEYYPLKDMLLIVLHSNSKLYFHGLMSVTVLQGVIEVLGYTLNNSSRCAEIFSPRGSSFLYLETKDEYFSSPVQKNLSNALSTLGMDSQAVSEVCQGLQPGSAVVLCKKIIKPEIAFLEKHTSQQVFPKGDYPMLQCVFQNKIGAWNVLKPNVEWDSLASSIDSTSKAFICGGKSVGKSTMLRYMMNKLLLKYPEILVIDLDPGQPEFTVSACISATIVNEPVFGPNYTHLRQPSRCLFIPNINISYQPDGYLASVKELIHTCSNLPKIPTIINYMGFTRGLGLEIYSAVVAHVQPTCMIEILSSKSRRNFKEQLTHELICDRSKLLASNVDFIREFPIHTIESMADTNQGWHLEPRQIREMCVLSYLSKRFPQDVLSLTDSRVPIFVVNLSLIKIICNGEVVSPSVVNANLVALCSSRVSGISHTCYGWGVVRGVNLTTNELFLLTPVLPDQLEQVDYLILGSVSLPPSLYMTADNNTGLVPFVSQGVLTTLGQIPKRSHLPPRHKQD